jgi:hypothetical protein
MLLKKRCLPIIRKDRPFCKYLLIHQTSFFTFMPKGARIVRAPQGGYGLARVRDYARVLWFCSGLQTMAVESSNPSDILKVTESQKLFSMASVTPKSQ